MKQIPDEVEKLRAELKQVQELIMACTKVLRACDNTDTRGLDFSDPRFHEGWTAGIRAVGKDLRKALAPKASIL